MITLENIKEVDGIITATLKESYCFGWIKAETYVYLEKYSTHWRRLDTGGFTKGNVVEHLYNLYKFSTTLPLVKPPVSKRLQKLECFSKHTSVSAFIHPKQ